jgi:hypothetical protein
LPVGPGAPMFNALEFNLTRPRDNGQ